ncbi:MAG: PhnD/SsuA/transferrin family substrate-binding protein [Candidatus Schekmanbacteria bacterium]|nr:PhnD/SsuA/transferrin family substrate-binding protein [Candidatus Schekmanbacteria bacterium]
MACSGRVAFGLWAAVSGLLLPCLAAAAAPTLVLYYPDARFHDAVEAGSVLQKLAKDLSEGTGLEISAQFFQKGKDATEHFRSGRPTVGILDSRFYAEYGGEFGLTYLASPLVSGRTTYELALVVKADSAAKNIRDLAGTILATSYPGRIGAAFLSNIALEGHLDAQVHFGELRPVDSAASAIAAVLITEATAAFAPLDGLAEMGRAAEVRAILTTQPIPLPPLCMTRGALSEEDAQRLVSVFEKLGETASGRQILAGFGFTGFSRGPAPALTAAVSLLNAAPASVRKRPVIEESGAAGEMLVKTELPQLQPLLIPMPTYAEDDLLVAKKTPDDPQAADRE